MRGAGYELANSMGLRVVRTHHGDEGSVYVLDDGRVLKITSSGTEAAIALQLLDAQAAGSGHPSVPAIDRVLWINDTDSQDLTDEGYGPFPWFVVIREDFADFPVPQSMSERWDASLMRLQGALDMDDRDRMRQVIAQGESMADRLREVADGLVWTLEMTGFSMMDIRPINLGIGRAGALGLRDLGRADVAYGRPKRALMAMDRVRRLDFDEARLEPSFSPVLAPAP